MDTYSLTEMGHRLKSSGSRVMFMLIFQVELVSRPGCNDSFDFIWDSGFLSPIQG